MLRKTQRLSKFSPPGFRSKYIFIPNQVKMANNHLIYEFNKGTEVVVPTNVAFLHHYRGSCEEIAFNEENHQSFNVDPSMNCLNQANIIDRRIHIYKEALLQNVKRVLLEISDQCKIKF